ncbi:MAG: DUF5671 domain-containing protein [Anaerolineales bacterium]|jgi:hypothetical protein
MFTPRRFYIYVVSAVSLNAVAWAIISLLRSLIITGAESSASTIAFQIAVILIGLPIFLVHWLWAQRLAQQDEEEREAGLRRLYIYGTQAGFLAPIVHSSFAVISTVLLLPIGGVSRLDYSQLSSVKLILHHLIALIVLGILWYFQHRVNNADAAVVPLSDSGALIRRLYIFGFSVTGLVMTTVAIINLSRWLMFLVVGREIFSHWEGPLYEIARLIVGLSVWILFWRWAERLFAGPEDPERESALRKFYLYTAVFVSAMTTVTSLTFILEGFFRRLLQVPVGRGSEDIRVPISIIIGWAIVWGYHALVLREDAKAAKDLPRQRGIMRLYEYLIATIGLSAFLVGMSGILSVFIRAVEGLSFSFLANQLSWFAALTIAGLPVWFIPWRRAQLRSELSGDEGIGERRSTIRKAYLYIFLFVATMTVLASVVSLVFNFLSMLFGDPAPSLSEIGQPLAYSLIAVGVWLYHGFALRSDGQRILQDHAARIEEGLVAVVDVGQGSDLQQIIERMKKETPSVKPASILLAKDPKSAKGAKEKDEDLQLLRKAKVIVGPWMITVPGWGDGLIKPKFAREILKSPAVKVLIPSRDEGWEWAGVDLNKPQLHLRQAARAVRQILEGESVVPSKQLSIGGIIAIVIGSLLLLTVVGIPLIFLLTY